MSRYEWRRRLLQDEAAGLEAIERQLEYAVGQVKLLRHQRDVIRNRATQRVRLRLRVADGSVTREAKA